MAGNAQPVSKRLRLTSGGSAVGTPRDSVVNALEFDLTREDSSSDEMNPDAEVGATVVDPVAPTFVESRDSEPVRSNTSDSDVPTPCESSIPIGVIGDAVPSIHTSTRKALCPGKVIRIVKVIKIAFSFQIRLFHLLQLGWNGSLQVSSGWSPWMWTLFAKRACLMKAVPGFMKGAYRSAMRIALAEIDEGRSHHAFCARPAVGSCSCCCQGCCSTDPPEGARFRKHSCNVGWKHSRVESGHLFWPANERVQPEEFRLLRVASDVQSVTMSRAGPPEPRRWCTWAS